ncbi:MAG: formate dehydrogenase accessory sulfurtransferase FdhD [Vicinamibacterales bacterium]
MSTRLPSVAPSAAAEAAGPPDGPTRRRSIVTVDRGRPSADTDTVATEEPLQVRVDGEAFSVIMRTPGDDIDLTTGFLFAESVITRWKSVTAIAQGRDRAGLPLHNVIDVTLERPRAARPRGRRVTTTSSCGLCGRQTIESLTVSAPRVEATWSLTASAIVALPGALRRVQRVFDATGGLHGAALFDRRGTIVEWAEDVGRHNAVDKVIGRLVRADRLPLSDFGLVVSGRTSYEIVQKAYLAGVPIVVAVSAPSSLAIELAERGGLTLVGFVRDQRFVVYAHEERVAGAADAARG